MKKIQKVIEKNILENGESYEFMNYPQYDSETSLKIFNDYFLKDVKLTILEKKIIYEDDSEYILPIAENIHVLSDRTRFLIIFSEKPSKLSQNSEYPMFFLRPNNATIYNADGSLRHQLIVPDDLMNQGKLGKEGWYIHSTYYADFPHLKGFGVMVTNDHNWPALCFCLYDGTPNLVWTRYQQERR